MWGHKADAFERALDRALKADTLTEVVEHDDCLFQEVYTNECGQRISVHLYAYKGKTYVVRYVDDVCVSFFDVTPKGVGSK